MRRLKFHYLFLIIFFYCFSCSEEKRQRDNYFGQGNKALDRQQYILAIERYTKSLSIDPHYVDAINNRGVAYMESGQVYEAIIDYNLAVSLASEEIEIRMNRVYANEKIGRYKKSLADMKYLTKQVIDSAFLHYYLATLYTKLHQYDTAVDYFEQAHLLDSLNESITLRWCTTLLHDNKIDEAKRTVQQLSKNAETLNLLGLIAVKEGRVNDAMKYFNKAIELSPSNSDFINNKGYVFLLREQLDSALLFINRSIINDTQNKWAYRNKGIYYMKQNKPHKALRLFSQAANTVGFIDEIYSYQGEAAFAMSDLQQACIAWTKGVEQKERRSTLLLRTYCR